MKLFRSCIEAVKRRPIIISFFAILSVIWSYLDQFIFTLYKRFLSPYVSMALAYINIFAESKAQNIVAPGSAPVEEIPELIPVNILIPAIILFLFALFSISAILSFFVSGYSHVLNISLQPKEKTEGEFITGVTKHYFKFTIYIFIHLALTVLMGLVLFLASIPAVISLKLVFQGGFSDLILAAIFITLITLFVLFFALVSFMMYTSYMYPSLTNFKKGALFMARKVVNSYFWYLMPRYLGFIIIIAGWSVLMMLINYGIGSLAATIAAFVLNTFVKTTVMFLFVFFLFHSFRLIKNELQNASERK